MRAVGRFAPSITGQAHPGTLLSGLLAWLDVRSRGGLFSLRLEDLDHTRKRPGDAELMVEALGWLGIDWDEEVVQSEHSAHHDQALDDLESAGLLYPCQCSRAQIRATQERTPDGGFAYDNRCRGAKLPVGGWRNSLLPLRVQLPDRVATVEDESGVDLSQMPSRAFGDPVVRRRDGVTAYQLVVVVDDERAGVNRVVRGQDLASSTATQVQLRELLRLTIPTYRHHFLLLERHDQKLAKLHGSLPFVELRRLFSGPEFCGVLAHLAGFHPTAEPVTPNELVSRFSWENVRTGNLLFRPDS